MVRRRVLWGLSLVMLLCLIVGCRPETDHVTAVVPWPYGLMIFAGSDPQDTASFIDRATWAVESVFEHWGKSPPPTMPSWRTSLMRSEASSEAENLPGRSPLRVPGPEGAMTWCREPLCWRGESALNPLVLLIVQDRDDVVRLSGDRLCGAFFSSRDVRIDAYPYVVPGPVIVMTRDDVLNRPSRLCHEVNHWYFSVSLPNRAGGSIMLMLREGTATLVAEQITDSDRYRRISAVYAAESDLRDLPRSLAYSVGASVVEALGRDVRVSALWDACRASDLLVRWGGGRTWWKTRNSSQWECVVHVVDSEWRAQLSAVEPNAEDRCAYELVVHRFESVVWLLEPFLSEATRQLVEEIRAGEVMDDPMEVFWESVDAEFAEPQGIGSVKLREGALAKDLFETAVYEAPPAELWRISDNRAKRYLWRLVWLRWIRDWDAYHRELVRVVRTHVAEGVAIPSLVPG